MTLGERLTALRKGAGLSQEQMAAELILRLFSASTV